MKTKLRRMPGPSEDLPAVVREAVDAVFGGRVPQPDGAVVSAGRNETPIRRKPAATKGKETTLYDCSDRWKICKGG